MMIGVKNNRPAKDNQGNAIKANTLRARYDGQEYVFEPGIPTAISEEAAKHIFGYGEKDKARALHRLGWMTYGGQMENALEQLNDFTFLEVEAPKFKDVTEIAAPPALDKTLHLPKPDPAKSKFG
jgi:hypothetical protein